MNKRFGLALHSTAGDDQGTDGVRALKHTPGPWEIHEGGNFVRVGGRGYVERICKDWYGGGPLAVAEMEYRATENYEPNHALAMANAQLIAAAPDLLEACLDARGWFPINGASAKTRARLDAAIAKAEGRA